MGGSGSPRVTVTSVRVDVLRYWPERGAFCPGRKVGFLAMTITSSSVGALIRRAREASGLSREELANRAGVSASAVGTWERGEHAPDAVSLLRVLTALGKHSISWSDSQNKAQHVVFSPPGYAVISGAVHCPMAGRGVDVRSCPGCTHFRGLGVMYGHGAEPALAVTCDLVSAPADAVGLDEEAA